MRRDLRLNDNAALLAAVQAGEAIIPLFILDPYFDSSRDTPRYAFLMQALKQLDTDLRQRGSRLILRSGRPLEVLTHLVQESGALGIYAEADFSPYSQDRDVNIQRHLPLHLVGSTCVHPPPAVVKADGSPYTVFTPFSRAWRQLPLEPQPPIPAPDHFSAAPQFDSLPVVETQASTCFPVGEAEAHRRLADFLQTGLSQYASHRDRLDLEGTSTLSPYLRFGQLLARRAVFEAGRVIKSTLDAQSRKGGETWLNELIWREFYQMILYRFPFVLKTAFRPELRQIPWLESDENLRAWQTGLTGYPVVDAGMRQLATTGWMHNRARMITASFLVKDLLINWQEGERWFMQHLLDGDPAANNGGWQWTAGVGTDAAPYFRVFSPRLQGEKFDPLGDYVRRWVPELAQVPRTYIHQPELMPEVLQQNVKCRIGRDYPRPIVDHQQARLRVLAVYKNARLKTRGT